MSCFTNRGHEGSVGAAGGRSAALTPTAAGPATAAAATAVCSLIDGDHPEFGQFEQADGEADHFALQHSDEQMMFLRQPSQRGMNISCLTALYQPGSPSSKSSTRA